MHASSSAPIHPPRAQPQPSLPDRDSLADLAPPDLAHAGLAAALADERREAARLVDELLATPEALAATRHDARYLSPSVVQRLVEASKAEARGQALRLLRLAERLALQLTARRQDAVCRGALVEVRFARVRRLLAATNLRAAARDLEMARRGLAPDLHFERAVYCRLLARLRGCEELWEEALALSARAVSLLGLYGTALEIGQAQIEQGWLLIEAGDPDEAVEVFEAALPGVAGLPRLAEMARLGLAMARAESGDFRDVRVLTGLQGTPPW
jgi:tetratricopeptide (TPR) repeat protein